MNSITVKKRKLECDFGQFNMIVILAAVSPTNNPTARDVGKAKLTASARTTPAAEARDTKGRSTPTSLPESHGTSWIQLRHKCYY